MPCRSCPRRSTCREICPKLEAKLPKLRETEMQGRRCNYERLRELVRRVGASRMVLRLRWCLRAREREVVDLIFNKSLTVEEVAGAMHTSVENVSRLRRRAFVRMGRKLAQKPARSGVAGQSPQDEATAIDGRKHDRQVSG